MKTPYLYRFCPPEARDVTFGEDASTARTGAGPHVMAALGNLAISILGLAGHTQIARALRHAARNPPAGSAYSQARSDGQ